MYTNSAASAPLPATRRRPSTSASDFEAVLCFRTVLEHRSEWRARCGCLELSRVCCQCASPWCRARVLSLPSPGSAIISRIRRSMIASPRPPHASPLTHGSLRPHAQHPGLSRPRAAATCPFRSAMTHGVLPGRPCSFAGALRTCTCILGPGGTRAIGPGRVVERLWSAASRQACALGAAHARRCCFTPRDARSARSSCPRASCCAMPEAQDAPRRGVVGATPAAHGRYPA